MKHVEIKYTKKAMKGYKQLSQDELAIMDFLEQDLRDTAGKPFGRRWSSLGMLKGTNRMHCHITYRKVAIWQVIEHDDSVEVIFCRFEYIGTREKAPY